MISGRFGGAARRGVLAAILGIATASPALAAAAAAQNQTRAEVDAEAEAAEETELSEVVVTAAAAQPGAVISDIKPEIQLGPAAIASYGVGSITDLLAELAPQIRSDAARGGESTIILVNGRRISGFNEIRDIPTEAILRMDILPEEAALRYGYPATQRVVNIVLRRRFRAFTTELSAGGPTQGGQINTQLEANDTRIRGDNRINWGMELKTSSALTEDERGIVAPAGRRPYDLVGNITGTLAGGEIDPALSALAGRPVTAAGVPAGADPAALTLGDFAGTAGTLNVSDVGRYRTLSPATQDFSINGVLHRALSHGISATLNATLGATSSDTRQGLPGVSLLVPGADPFSPFGSDVRLNRYVDTLGPLRQSVDGWTGHLGFSANKDFGRWRSSLTGSYDHADSRTVSDTGLDPTIMQALLNGLAPDFNPFAPLPGQVLTLQPQNKARSLSDTANLQLVVNGPLLKVPAGRVNGSVKVGDSYSSFDSRSFRFGTLRTADLSRNDFSLRGSLDVPIASRGANVLAALGELSFNANAEIDRLSDFGTLTSTGYGLRWTPVTPLRLIVATQTEEAAPTTTQLGSPLVLTEGSRVFDFQTGRTVDVTQISGGNPALLGDRRKLLRINLNFKPFAERDLNFTASYLDSRTRNPIQNLSTSPDLQAAFPERFIRDADGDLVQVDSRPVNFARRDGRELRWGVNFSRTFGRPPARREPPAGVVRRRDAADGPPTPGAPEGPPPQAGNRQGAPSSPRAADGPGSGGGPRGGGGAGAGGFRGGGGGGGGRFGGGPPGGAQPRLQFALYHTVKFEDRLLVRQGGPLLDLLDGASLTGSGTSRHEIEAQAGYSANGLGARLSANWKSGYTVQGGLLSPTGDLHFSDLATINLRFFGDLGQIRWLARNRPWLRGARINLVVDNLFNQRIQVRDTSGGTPLRYQPAYLDPSGRDVRVTVRKLF